MLVGSTAPLAAARLGRCRRWHNRALSSPVAGPTRGVRGVDAHGAGVQAVRVKPACVGPGVGGRVRHGGREVAVLTIGVRVARLAAEAGVATSCVATTAVAAVSVKHGVCTRASAAESADSSPPHPLAGVHRVHYRPVAMKPGVNLAEHTDPRHRPVLKN